MGGDRWRMLQALVDADGRYRREAYAFTLEAFNYTLEQRRRKGLVGHVDGRELCEGIREYAEKSFGFLTKAVFSQWGITRTSDFGEIVFAMVNAGLLSKQDSDTKEDFVDAFEFDDVFEKELLYE